MITDFSFADAFQGRAGAGASLQLKGQPAAQADQSSLLWHSPKRPSEF